MTAPLDIARLKAAAEAAEPHAPSPWFDAYARIVSGPLSAEYDRLEREIPENAADDDSRWAALPDPDVCHLIASHGDTLSPQRTAVARHIAAWSPQTALAVLDEVERLRKHVAHNNEEYAVMKEVLRTEHAALQNFRALSVGVTGADASDTIGEIKVHYADGSTMYLADAFERAAGPDPVPYDLASLEEAAHRSRADLLDNQANLDVASARLLALEAGLRETCDLADRANHPQAMPTHAQWCEWRDRIAALRSLADGEGK